MMEQNQNSPSENAELEMVENEKLEEKENYIIVRKFNQSYVMNGYHVFQNTERDLPRTAANSNVLICYKEAFAKLIAKYLQDLITEYTLRYLNIANLDVFTRVFHGAANEVLFHCPLSTEQNCLEHVFDYMGRGHIINSYQDSNIYTSYYNAYDFCQILKRHYIHCLQYDNFYNIPKWLFDYQLPQQWQWTNITHITPSNLDGEGMTKVLMYGKCSIMDEHSLECSSVDGFFF